MYRRRFRRRGPSAKWLWADNGSNAAGPLGGAGLLAVGGPIVPPDRVSWLLDNQLRRDSLTIKRIVGFIYVSVTNGNGGAAFMPGVDLFICKGEQDAEGTSAKDFVPFQPPVPPGAAGTAWYGSGSVNEDDGLDPFLWTGHLPTPDYEQGAGVTLTYPMWYRPGSVSPGGARDYSCGSEAGYGVYIPTHDIKVKRRLRHDEGIILGARMIVNGDAPNWELELSWHLRVLGS